MNTLPLFARCVACGAEFDGTQAEVARAAKAHLQVWSEGIQASVDRVQAFWTATTGGGEL